MRGRPNAATDCNKMGSQAVAAVEPGAHRHHLPAVDPGLLCCGLFVLAAHRHRRQQMGFHLDNWQLIFSDPFYRDILLATFRIAAISTVVCALMGYIPAYFVAYTKMRHKAFLLLLLMLPFWISYIIRNMSWISVLDSSGLLNTILLWLGIIDAPLK